MADWNDLDLYNPTEEHKMLRQMVREFTQGEVEPQAESFDRKEEFNLPLFRKLGEIGLLGITVPDEYGGAGMDAMAAVIAHEELSTSDPGFCLAYLAHSMLCVNNLAVNGSEEQKQKYLPGLCSGELVGCMAMSEPHVGTDVLGMKTKAVKKDGGYVINGQKMWITNGVLDEKGTRADLVWLYACTGQNEKGRPELSTFLVDNSCDGYKVGQKIQDKTGMRGSNTADLVFENAFVEANALVGKEGESMHHMMRNLEIERLTLAAMSLGIARRSIAVMLKYANEREAFGKPIAAFGQIQKYISDSYAQYMVCSLRLHDVARKLDLKAGGQRVDSDGVKLVATTMGKQVADNAIQVLGGYGYVGEYTVERLWRDAKLLEIGGGTLESHQKNITKDLSRNPELVV
ncbi:MAG: acyl-CoA dehydrogenase family protein [Bdellovibrionales bacterium]